SGGLSTIGRVPPINSESTDAAVSALATWLTARNASSVQTASWRSMLRRRVARARPVDARLGVLVAEDDHGQLPGRPRSCERPFAGPAVNLRIDLQPPKAAEDLVGLAVLQCANLDIAVDRIWPLANQLQGDDPRSCRRSGRSIGRGGAKRVGHFVDAGS